MAVYFVSQTTGNDANDGLSPQTPKRNIQSAVNLAVAGDTIYVGPGRYKETITTKSNISGGVVQIIADPYAEKLVYDLPGEVWIVGDMLWNGSYNTTTLTIGMNVYSNYVIKGFKFTFHSSNDIVLYGTNIKVVDCKFYSSATYQIVEHSSISNIDGLVIENCKFSTSKAGIRINNSGTTGVVEIKNCSFEGESTGTAIYRNSNSVTLFIRGCEFLSQSTAVYVNTGSSNYTYIFGCKFEGNNTCIRFNTTSILCAVYGSVFDNNAIVFAGNVPSQWTMTDCHFYRNDSLGSLSLANTFCNFYENYAMGSISPGAGATYLDYSDDYPMPFGLVPEKTSPINGLQSGKIPVYNAGFTIFDVPVERGVETTIRLLAKKNFTGKVVFKLGTSEVVMADNTELQTIEIKWTSKKRKFEKLIVLAETQSRQDTNKTNALLIDNIQVL
ncbi:MAG: hypothetical protein N2043_02120 [Ignavibacterium sp.]|nr:hypothetical protein [Ignavibacterium sp.]